MNILNYNTAKDTKLISVDFSFEMDEYSEYVNADVKALIDNRKVERKLSIQLANCEYTADSQIYDDTKKKLKLDDDAEAILYEFDLIEKAEKFLARKHYEDKSYTDFINALYTIRKIKNIKGKAIEYRLMGHDSSNQYYIIATFESKKEAIKYMKQL